MILERGNRGGEPHGRLNLLPGEFPGCSMGEGTRAEPRSLPELRKQSWESGWLEVAGQYTREKRTGEKEGGDLTEPSAEY